MGEGVLPASKTPLLYLSPDHFDSSDRTNFVQTRWF